jgi:hypothetical protein
MILHFKVLGGLGISYQGRIDLSELPYELYEQVMIELSENKLQQLERKQKSQLRTDSSFYELRYENSDRKFSIEESQASDEVLDLIDALKPFLVLETG